MNPRFHPSLLTLDNEMERFLQEHKRKIANQGRGIAPLTESITVGDERVSGFHRQPGRFASLAASTENNRKTATAHKERGIADSQKSRFSVEGVIALLCVAAYVIWYVWQAVEQF